MNQQQSPSDPFNTLKALRALKKQSNAKPAIKESLLFMEKKQPITQQELRSQFQGQLSKLSELSTKEQGIRESRKLIQQNQSPASFQTLLSCLCVPTVLKSNDGILRIVQIVIDVYQANCSVQDLYKLLEIVMKHFKDVALPVQIACCEVWQTAYNGFAARLTIQQRSLILFQTLAGIISGGTSYQEQETAVACLHKLFEVVVDHKDVIFLKDIVKQYIQLFLRSQIEHCSLYLSIDAILQGLRVQDFQNMQMQIIDKCLKCLSTVKINYKVRVSAATVLKTIGIHYQNNQFNVIGSYHDQVIQKIEEYTKDRLIAVQNASRVALKEWAKVKLQVEDVNHKKQERVLDEDDNDFERMIERETDVKVLEPVTNPPTSTSNKKFQKKNTGLGGGQVNSEQNLPQKTTENKHNKQIKNMVYNGFQIYNSSDVFLPAAQSDDLDQTIDYNEVQSKSKVYTVRANSIEKSRPSAIKAIKAQQQIVKLPQQITKNQEASETQSVWGSTLKHLASNRVSDAVNYLLHEGDDIYLLRLLALQTDMENFITLLDTDTKQKLFSRLLLVFESDFLNRICLDFIQDFQEAGVGEMVQETQFLEFLKNMGQQDDISGLHAQQILQQF